MPHCRWWEQNFSLGWLRVSNRPLKLTRPPKPTDPIARPLPGSTYLDGYGLRFWKNSDFTGHGFYIFGRVTNRPDGPNWYKKTKQISNQWVRDSHPTPSVPHHSLLISFMFLTVSVLSHDSLPHSQLSLFETIRNMKKNKWRVGVGLGLGRGGLQGLEVNWTKTTPQLRIVTRAILP